MSIQEIETKLEELRKEWKLSLPDRREIIQRQARALQIIKERKK